MMVVERAVVERVMFWALVVAVKEAAATAAATGEEVKAAATGEVVRVEETVGEE